MNLWIYELARKIKLFVFLFCLGVVCIPILHAAGIESGNWTYREKDYTAYLGKNNYTGVLSKNNVVVLISQYGEESPDTSSVSWTFNCTDEGFYNICIEYMPLPGPGSAIERRLLLDGKAVYKGMEQLVFNRCFSFPGPENAMLGNRGNEIRRRWTEVFEKNRVYVSDSQKRNIEPYIVYLSEGGHTLTLEPLKGAMLIYGMEFAAAPEIPPYAHNAGALKYTGAPLVFQAERSGVGTYRILKSSQSIRNETDYTSVDTFPYHPWKIRLNVIGGLSWRMPGDVLSWEIDVPEEGLYGLSFRGAQNMNRGVISYRRLYINGETPFTEAACEGFAYTSKFRQYDLSKDGHYFYLYKGSNTISLENIVGIYAKPLSEVEESLMVLNNLYLRIIQVTGLVPDRFIDYDIVSKVDNFTEILVSESERLYGVIDSLVGISGEKNSGTGIIEAMAAQAARISKKSERIIPELNTFKGNISALGSWIISVSEMPLYLDSLTLYAPDSGYYPKETNVIIKIWRGLVRFLATFFIDETKLGDEEVSSNALRVWVPTGRDQAQIVKNMSDDSFVPKFNIPVEVQLIPMDVVIPASLSGSGPDVLFSMGQAQVLNFAIRNALAGMSNFNGYSSVIGRFYTSAIEPVTFLDEVYGIPETQSFPMMYVRDDILAEAGIKVPECWDEFRNAIVELNIRNYDVYIPTFIYDSLVYQYGGRLYEGTGRDYGISTGLYSEAAMEAFSDYTGFYTAYKVPVSADFANRFRTGEMPLGIADYTLYNTLELFAPEIRGLWSFHPLPGKRDSAGYINNTVIAGSAYTVIMADSKNKEAAWKYVTWWLSTDAQTEYALQLEAILGTAGRYNTANPEVIGSLAWSQDAISALLSQLKNTVGIPEMPGSYMSSRMKDYAFASVVTGRNAMAPRQALYMNLPAIDRELARKRQEFNLSVIEDNLK